VVWGPGEEELARQVVESARPAAVLAPATDLHALAAILRRAALLVTNDTGPMHLGVACGVPVVALFSVADADRWAVSVLDFERLVASATTSELRLVLHIEDDVGAVLARSPIGVGGATVSADATVGVGLSQTLFVRAFSEQGQVGPYTIRLFKENQGSCAPDDAEPNDAITTRKALPSSDALLTICESDEDFFLLTGVAGKRATIDATFSHGDADLDVQLLGLDGRQILATADSASDNEHLEVILPLDGEYTVRVLSLTSGARARYTLSAVVESPP
jgi:hypothetical protein